MLAHAAVRDAATHRSSSVVLSCQRGGNCRRGYRVGCDLVGLRLVETATPSFISLRRMVGRIGGLIRSAQMFHQELLQRVSICSRDMPCTLPLSVTLHSTTPPSVLVNAASSSARSLRRGLRGALPANSISLNSQSAIFAEAYLASDLFVAEIHDLSPICHFAFCLTVTVFVCYIQDFVVI